MGIQFKIRGSNFYSLNPMNWRERMHFCSSFHGCVTNYSIQLFIICIDSVGQEFRQSTSGMALFCSTMIRFLQAGTVWTLVLSHVWQSMLVHNQLEDIINDTTSFTRTTKKTKKEQGMRKMFMKGILKFYCGCKSIENTFYISELKKILKSTRIVILPMSIYNFNVCLLK